LYIEVAAQTRTLDKQSLTWLDGKNSPLHFGAKGTVMNCYGIHLHFRRILSTLSKCDCGSSFKVSVSLSLQITPTELR